MDYTELAKEFLQNTYNFRRHGQQKKIDETMQGEAFVMLYILRQGSNVLPSEISTEMNISSARIAAVLNSLENKGFVTRQIDKIDRRRILVDLTPEGREMAQKHYQMAVNGTARMLELLGEQDAKELVRIVGRLTELAPLAPESSNCN